jgi:peptide/nickel transport system permease protein
MLSYILRRLGLAIVTVLAISVISFAIIQLPPGDYVDAYVAQLQSSGTLVTQDVITNLRAEYGLGQPIYVQYGKWMGKLVHGDLGESLQYKRPVTDVIGSRLALTMVVSLFALLLTWIIALPIGIYSAMRQYSFADYIFTFISFLGLAVPSFLLALIIMYFSFRYFGADIGGLFSSQYQTAPWSWAKVVNLLGHIPVPAIVLGLAGTAEAMRIMRANLLDEIRKPYVVTARAKGMTERQAILKYPVRVALNPFASTIGYSLPYIVSGSIIVSIVLSLPTVGPLLLNALQAQDMYLAGAIVLLLGALTVIGTFLSDLLLLWIDPRIRLGV